MDMAKYFPNHDDKWITPDALSTIAMVVENNTDRETTRWLYSLGIDSEDTLLMIAVKLEDAGIAPVRYYGPIGDLPEWTRDVDVRERAGNPIRVRIEKGTRIYGTFPASDKDQRNDNGRRYKVAGRSYWVSAHRVDGGTARRDYEQVHVHNPEMNWAGAGGYWHYIDMNDIVEVEV